MINIIENTVSEMRLDTQILSIVDNLNNSYTLYFLQKDNILRVGQTIEIQGSDNFNGSYTIKGLNANSLIINKQKGIPETGVLGVIKQKAPFTDFGTWVSYSNFLDGEINFKNELEQNTFPAIKLAEFETYKGKINNEIDNLEIFFIDFTKSNKLDKERILEMEYLRGVASLFISTLIKQRQIIDFEVTMQEYRFAKLVTDNFTNVIRLKLTKLKYLNCTITN